MPVGVQVGNDNSVLAEEMGSRELIQGYMIAWMKRVGGEGVKKAPMFLACTIRWMVVLLNTVA